MSLSEENMIATPWMDFAGFETAEWLPEGEIADDVEGDEV